MSFKVLPQQYRKNFQESCTKKKETAGLIIMAKKNAKNMKGD